MTPEEARSLGRAIRTARTERGMTQMKVAMKAGVSTGQLGIWERGNVPAARGRAAHPPTITRDQLESLATALDCSPADIADRAALTASSRVLYGLEPLGAFRTGVRATCVDLFPTESVW